MSISATAWVALMGVMLLGAWTIWLFVARIPMYEVSRSARLEVDAAPYPVHVLVSAGVLRSSLVLGQSVSAGDLLLELDAEAQVLQLERERARVSALGPQIEALGREKAHAESAVSGEDRLADASLGEASAKQRASHVLAHLKETEKGQLETLRTRQIVAAIESERMGAEAEQRRADAQAADVVIEKLGRERTLRKSERLAKVARLEQEIAQLKGQQADAEALIRELKRQIALHTVRAPVTGRLGDIVSLRPGGMVDAGTRVAVVVPAGQLRAVAFFELATVGRVRVGQTARFRLPGFPWTKYGTLSGRVARVGTESQDGSVRVELLVTRNQDSSIPVQHGLQATVEVEVERLSPAALLLDAAGRFVTAKNTAAMPPTGDRR